MTDIANGFFEWLFSILSNFLVTIIDSVLGVFLDIFDSLFGYIVDFFTDSRFERSGASFFSTIYSKVSHFNFTFNIIYWVVGLFLGLYIFKNVIIPLYIAIVDTVADFISSQFNMLD